MTFEEYQQRPVYRAQCATFAICREFLGAPSGDLATGSDHPILHFRVLPPYRNAYSLALRKKIADLVRAERQRNRHPGFASAGNFVRATEAARAAITRATEADA